MSVTVVNDWCFLEKADVQDGMAAIRKYMDYLKNNDTGLEQSLWLKSSENHLRYFHIATYKTRKALDLQMESEGTMRFIQRLTPLIDEKTVAITPGPTIANTGTGPGEI